MAPGMRAKLRNLKAAALLRDGYLIAHAASTLPGVACLPHSKRAVDMLQRFKQRRGPFLLLADSTKTALAQARFIPPSLRRHARGEWPGRTTLVFPGKPGLPRVCYQRNEVALRVDQDPAVRQLASLCGGLLLSSSLNRKGKPTALPTLAFRMRHHRYLRGHIAGRPHFGKASTIIRIWRNHATIIRP